MADPVTIVVSIAGGSLGGGLLTWWQSAGVRRSTRRGRARMVHEDLYRLQSTVARIYFQASDENPWGKKAWVLEPLASTEDQQDVLAHMRGWMFPACASALGWAQYVRSGHDATEGPTDEELETIYRRLAWGRAAIAKMRFSGFDYTPHKAEDLVRDKKTRNEDGELPLIEKERAEKEAKEYRSSDDTASDDTAIRSPEDRA